MRVSGDAARDQERERAVICSTVLVGCVTTRGSCGPAVT